MRQVRAEEEGPVAAVVLEAGTFMGHPVMRVQIEGEPYVVIRPLVQALGWDWAVQLGRIIDARMLQHAGVEGPWVSRWVRFPREAPPGQVPYRIEAAIRERDLVAWAAYVQSKKGL